VTGPQRLALHEAARTALGDEEAATLMALTPPADTDMATRQDLERVEERLSMRMVALEDRLDARFVALEDRLNARIGQSVSDASAALIKRMHGSELRTMGVIVVATLGSRLIG